MSSIDRRIVEMQFDNKQFEKGVKETTDSLSNLKQGLNLSESLSGIQSSVDKISERFSGMGIAIMSVIQNITNKVVDLGLELVKNLTITPLLDGFAEYELKMGSIQTIMAGTGEPLEVVNKYLDELNTYADKTIYSFSDMTQNIGKFTNAGVKLKDAVGAIQGVANVAAVSGANTNEASRAMYNFAQALSAGYVKLIDWKSIENANMATVEFKTQLLDAAVKAGTLKKQADGMYRVLSENNKGKTMEQTISATKNFNDSLSYQWMTTEALVSTLNDYADETTAIGKKAFAAATEVKTFSQLVDTLKEALGTGWATSFEWMIGDFEQAKKVFTGLSDTIGGYIEKVADARNEMLSFWSQNGGREAAIEALTNAFKALGNILKPIGQAWREVFPAMTGERLVEITNKIRDVTRNFKISDETAQNLKNTFKGLFSVLNIVKQVLGALIGAVGKVIGAFAPAGDGVLGFTGGLGKLITKLDNAIEKTGVFKIVFNGLATILIKAAEAIAWAIGHITDAWQWLTSKIDLSWFSIFGKIAESIGKAFKWMGGIVKEAMSNLGFDSVLDVVNGGILAAILLGVRKFMKSLTDITDNAGGFLKGITNILDGIKGSLEAWQTSLKANALLKIGIAIGILSVSILLLSTIDPAKMTVALAAITGLFIELFGSMAIFSKIMKSEGFRSMNKVTTAMIGMSVAVLILAKAMKTIADLSWGQIARGLTAIGVLMVELIAMSVILDKSKTKMVKGSAGLILFSTAILILAQGC